MELAAIRRRTRDRDADGMAVAAFVLGLLGLLVMNLVLGPIAIVLASLSLLYADQAPRPRPARARARRRRPRGLLALVMADHTVSWGLGG